MTKERPILFSAHMVRAILEGRKTQTRRVVKLKNGLARNGADIDVLATQPGVAADACPYGANYPDGTCIDGFMWDLDSCDEPKGPLHTGGDIPCPFCNAEKHIEYYKDDYVERVLMDAHPNTDPDDFTDAMWNVEGPQLVEKMLRGYLEKLHAEYGWTP
ncbi:MAG TPA: hypothetical protein PLX33_09815 [Alphaproteobacteria bacterium]|nr:hypothetical protein [Alphaproteobacteria bacterium]